MLIGGEPGYLQYIFVDTFPSTSSKPCESIPQEKTRSLIPQADSVIVNCSDEVRKMPYFSNNYEMYKRGNCRHCGSFCVKWHEQICRAAFSRCFICRNYGHYGRICRLSGERQRSRGKQSIRSISKKKKSKSRQIRDTKRQKEYFERKNSMIEDNLPF